MRVHVLACDYDGTIAEAGRVSEPTLTALARVRETGRHLVLVTGRVLPDLKALFPQLDQLFEAVVAENGAVLYFPERRETKVVGTAPEEALLEALRARGVVFVPGNSLIASLEAFAEPALAAVRDVGVERTLVFNKGSMMLLPGGVTKGTGLVQALATMRLSPRNTVGIGDAENDHAFLTVCECAVAVADAVPALRDRADYVTRGAGPRGAVEFIEEHVFADLAEILPALTRHRLPLGEAPAGAPVVIPAYDTHLLVVGPSGTGKSTIVGVLLERLVEAGRSFCLLDPEGDYVGLSALEGVVVLGGGSQQALPAAEDLAQLHRASTSVVLNMSAMSRTEKVNYATTALGAAAVVWKSAGMPHWLLIDEAHHLFPADGSSATEWMTAGWDASCLVTLAAESLAPAVLAKINAVAATDVTAFADALRALGKTTGWGLPEAQRALEPGEAVLGRVGSEGVQAVRFQLARRRIEHRRHVRKYAEGELPPDRSFYFRGPAGALNLRAANLVRFCELADGVDEGTWAHHLAAGDYSRWLREQVKDGELADEVRAVEAEAGLSSGESRRRILDEIRHRYSV